MFLHVKLIPYCAYFAAGVSLLNSNLLPYGQLLATWDDVNVHVIPVYSGSANGVFHGLSLKTFNIILKTHLLVRLLRLSEMGKQNRTLELVLIIVFKDKILLTIYVCACNAGIF